MSLRGVLLWIIGVVLMTVGLVIYRVSLARAPVPSAAAVGSILPEQTGQSVPQSESAKVTGSAPIFSDVATAAGVQFTCRTGEESDFYTILESLGGGIGLLDYDGDGWLDLYCVGGGRFTSRTAHGIEGLPGRLYRNEGNLKFRDVTIAAGLDTATMYSHGATVLDWNQDGRPDLLISGYGGLTLYCNEDGRRFRNVTREAGLTDARWSTSVAAADLWGRGQSDLFVCRYVDWSFARDPVCPLRGQSEGRDVCAPQNFAAVPSSIYSSDAGVYRDHWEQLKPATEGKALGVVIVDVNADARPDIYVANDASPNWLFINEGNGNFRECGQAVGAAMDDSGRYNGSMGVDASDFDASGLASLWVTNFESELPALYRNTGTAGFAYASQSAGIGRLGGQNVGFGTSFLDYDNDGWEDLVFVNGHVVRYPVGADVQQKPVLLRNVERGGRRMYQDTTASAGSWFQSAALGRGLSTGDLDNDGWPDVVVSHSNSPVAILRNGGKAAQGAAAERHWLGLQLQGRGHRPLAGATVTVQLNDRRVTRFIRGGGSYLSTGDSRLLVGLGAEQQVTSVTVQWPWGQQQQWTVPAVDRYWLLREGESEMLDAAGAPIGW